MKTVNIRYGLDTMSKNVQDGTTFAQLTQDASIRAGVGCGDNVKATVNGIEMPSDALVQDGATVVFETKCNTKAQDTKQVNIRYGLDTVSKAVPYDATVGDLVGDSNIQAALGFGDNVRATINGIQMPREAVVPNGGTLVVETACNTKAV